MARKLNKYERRIMFNVYLIRTLCGISIALNLILPILENPKFTFFILSQLVAIFAIHVYALVNVVGNQSVPIAATFFIRLLQSLIFILWRGDISWTTMGIFAFLDLMLIILLVLDKSNYRYGQVEASQDEFLKLSRK